MYELYNTLLLEQHRLYYYQMMHDCIGRETHYTAVKNEKVPGEIKNAIGAKNATVEENKNEVFIYGQEIHDCYTLQYDELFTVTTSALQEVDRQQQADKARIAELENQISNLTSTVATQQSLINDILERLKNLEAKYQ